MRRSFSEAIANWYSRYFPDAFILVLVLSVVTIVAGYAFTDTSAIGVLGHWFDGIPGNFEFAFQLMFTYAAALVLVDTPAVQNVIRKLTRFFKTPSSVYISTSIGGALTSFLGWYVGPIVTAIFARTLAKQVSGVDYRLLCGIAYASFTVSLTGISGTVPLLVATEGELTELLGGTYGLDQTTFSTMNLVSCATIVLVTTIIFYVIGKNKTNVVTFHDLVINKNEVASSLEPELEQREVFQEENRTFADKINSLRSVILIPGILGLIFLVIFFINEGLGGLNLNTVAFIALIMGLLVQKNAVNYAKLFTKNLTATGGIAIQFPLYSGIAQVLIGTGLAGMLTSAMVAISNESTFPLMNFLMTGFLNLFTPSAGGQFTATAQFFIPAAESLGVDTTRAIMSYVYGDIWTNLLQPFWALLYFSLLAAGTRLKVRDFMGYCFPILIAVGIIWGISLLVLPM